MCNHQKDVFAISLMDTVYTKREEAGKALLGLLGMAMNRTEPVSIGQYKGFDLQIAYFAMDKMYLAYLVGSGINPVQLGADAVGNTMRLDNCLHNLPQSVTDLESKLMQLQKQLEKGDGWQPTGNANEYQLAEIFSSDTGNIRVQGLPYGTYLVVETTTPKDLYQTYGNKPYPIAAVENTKQIEKAIDVMREISPIPVLPKNEVEGCCYDAERQELVFCAAIPPQELLQRLPAEIVMATAESSYAGISENELLRQTAAAISVEVCGRLGLPMPPDAFQTLEGMRDHIPDGEERRTLEKVREMAVTFGDAVCKRLKLERGQPAPQQEER